MQFEGRGMRMNLSYNILKDFARRINLKFETGHNEINIFILRGAKPIHNQDVVDSLSEIDTQIGDYDRIHEYQRTLGKLKTNQGELVKSVPNQNDMFIMQGPINSLSQLLAQMPVNLTNLILGGRQAQDRILNEFRCRLADIERSFRQLEIVYTAHGNNTAVSLIRQELEISRQIEDLLNELQHLLHNQLQDQVCSIELADNIMDRYNDVLILVWKDGQNIPHVRAVLCSADPGSRYIENPMGDHPGAASIAPGNYSAQWGRHNGYPCLDITRNDSIYVSGRRITNYHIDRGTNQARTRAGREDDTITVTEYTYYQQGSNHNPGEMQIHAGGEPDKIIVDWSGGCTVVCGTNEFDYSDPADSYRQIFGSAQLASPDSWLGIDPGGASNARFNIIVWNAWSLYTYKQSRMGRGNFWPVLEFGAEDLPDQYQGDPTAERWVSRMQLAVMRQTLKLIQGIQAHETDLKALFKVFKEALHMSDEQLEVLPDRIKELIKEWRLFIPEDMDFPKFKTIPVKKDTQGCEAGIFGNVTAEVLRTFQLSCFLLLSAHCLITSKSISKIELMWERNQWICGPQTWMLLEGSISVVSPPGGPSLNLDN